MQFYDRAKIHLKAGAGGNGSPHMRHEKFAPMGGPDGGDGGRGGSIFCEADTGLNTLADFHFHQHFKATPGGPGLGKKMHGAAGEDLILKVPAGTIIRRDDTDEFLADLTDPGQQVMVARGGRGGLGNTHFMTSTNRAPRESQKGEPGEELWLRLELKLIADVGLVGYPNAGKSTLLSVVSAARPKIANYPFTTLVPNLGVVAVDGYSFVLADIPGLIEGASEGVGLGHEFLRHVERTRLLVHLLDGAALERDPWTDFLTINQELRQYNEQLAAKPQIIVLNKIDVPEAQEHATAVRKKAEEAGYEFYEISAATRQGVERLIQRVSVRLQELRREEQEQAALQPVLTEKIFRPQAEDDFIVFRKYGMFHVQGKKAERAVAMTNLENREGVDRLQKTLLKMGVTTALEEAGVQPGDRVVFGSVELLWGE